MKAKYWYIKERHNPQFEKPYYTALGNISQTEARKHENPLYGYNVLIRFETEKDYMEKCKELNI